VNPATSVLRAGALALRQLSGVMLHATDGRDVLLNDPDGWAVEQPALWWTGPAGSNGSGGGPWGHPIPGSTPYVGFAAIPSVARCTSLVCDILAALPWHVRRGGELLPSPDWIADPQALRLDGRVIDAATLPETRWSWLDFWIQWLTSALWFGDGFIYVPQRDAYGAPKPPLYVLNPLDVTLDKGAYWVANVELAPETIIHLRGQGPLVEGRGTGALERFAGTLGYTQTIRDYAAGVFYAGVPAGYLKVTKDGLKQENADDLKAKWMEAHGGRDRSIAVLNATTEFHPLTFTPVDAALIEAMAANQGEVANAFGVPPYMIGAPTDSNTYANVESRRQDLTTFTYLPWATRIEATLDAQLPRGTSVKVGLDALLRADTKTRYESYALGQIKPDGSGWMTTDEIRELEDRPPLGQPEMIA
jgi:HK97 family phage portal protein